MTPQEYLESIGCARLAITTNICDLLAGYRNATLNEVLEDEVWIGDGKAVLSENIEKLKIATPIQGSKELKDISKEDLFQLCLIFYKDGGKSIDGVEIERRVDVIECKYEKAIIILNLSTGSIGLKHRYFHQYINPNSIDTLTAYDFLRSRNYDIPNQYK